MNKRNVNYLLFLIALLFAPGCTDKQNNWISQQNEYSDQWKIDVESGYSFKAVYADANGNVYAIGSLGVIFSKLNNQSWKCENNYWGGAVLTAIYGQGDDVWVVGESGTIVHKKGNGPWLNEESNAGYVNLNAIYGKDDDIWVAGDNGTIVHKKGNGPWIKERHIVNYSIPRNYVLDVSLNAIYGHGDDIWTVGENGTIVHKKGNGPWIEEERNLYGSLNAIYGKGDDIWAVGDSRAIHKKGNGSWIEEERNIYGSLNAIYGKGDNVWAVGGGGVIVHKKGNGRWTREESSAGSASLHSIYGRGNDVWAVGENGTIVYKKGDESWIKEESNTGDCFLSAICGQGYDIWAVGDKGTITHKKGNQPWIKEENTASYVYPYSLKSIYAKGDDIWAFGDNGTIMYKQKNGSWIEEESNAGDAFLEDAYAQGNDVWIVGDKGTIVHKKGNGPWVKEESNAGDTWLNGAWGQGNDVWALGIDGSLLHKKGNDPWKKEESIAGDVSLNALYVQGNDAWTFGSNGTILHKEGNEPWKKEKSNAGNCFLRAIYGQGDDIWAVGDTGTIVHKKGDGPWKKEESNAGDINLTAIYGQGEDVWVVGSYSPYASLGVIVHKKGNGPWKKREIDTDCGNSPIIEYNNRIFIPCYNGFLYTKDENSLVFFPSKFRYDKCIKYDNHIYCIVNSGQGILKISLAENKYPIIDKYEYRLTPQMNPDHLNIDLNLKIPDKQKFKDLGDISLSLEAKVFDETRQEVKDSGYYPVNADFKLKDSGDNSRTYSINFEFAKTYRIVLGAERANKLCLRVIVKTQLGNFEEVVKLRDSKGNFYLTLNNDFWKKNKNWIIIGIAIVLYYLFWLILWWFSPLSFLRIHQSNFFQKLQSLPYPLNELLSVLNILFPASILSKTKHVLDAWVKVNKGPLFEKFENSETVKLVTNYVPLPIQIGNPKTGDLIDKPDIKLLQKLFNKRRTIIQVIGDGGTGKTTFAVKIAGWLIEAGNKNEPGGFARIPILLGSETNDLCKTIKELLKSWLAVDDIPDNFIKALLKKQRLVLIVDALSERAPDTQDHFKNIHGILLANALIITTRSKIDMQVMEGTDIYPMPLNSEKLLYFITTYLAAFENKPLKKVEEQLEFAKRIVGIIGSNNKNTKITPILVKLIIENALKDYDAEKVSFEQMIREMPGSIPEVYYEYLKKNNPFNSLVKNYLREDRMLKIAEIMGQLSLGDNYIPHEFPDTTAHNMISKEFPDLKVDPIQRFIDNGIIYKRQSLSNYFLRFNLDPMAEYLGASKAYDDVNKDQTDLSNFISKVERLSDDARGFKIAFEQIKEFKRKHG